MSTDRRNQLPTRIVLRDRRLDRRHEDDHHRASGKPPEPTECPKCHASFVGGRWTWEKAPADSFEHICPACRRIEDKFPAGYVMIKGEFFPEHRDDILHLIRNHEKKEMAARPLQRIMAIEDTREGTEVTTTDSHLARGIAEALHDAYKGELKLRYSRDENLVRASWKR
jgi:NMD protein affecting ribosome stability and mRNA decay